MNIIQEIYNKSDGFFHRLKDTDTGVVSQWTGYAFIAELGPFRGRIPDYWGSDKPCVYVEEGISCSIVEVDTKD